MRVVRVLLVLLSLSIVCAQEAKKGNPPQGQPTIPTTLSEAHAALERILPPEELARIDAMPSEDDMIQYHFGVGLNIRNGWGLWQGSPLAKHMQELGFTHPDHMSGVILSTFWCKRHGQDFRLEERATACKKAMEDMRQAQEEEKKRVEKAKAAMRKTMMGLRFERRDVPVVRMPNRIDRQLRARFLSPFHGGVFIAIYRRTAREDDAFVTPGYYYDPTDRTIHKIQVGEVNDIHSAVVAGQRAWFAGDTGGKAVLAGVNGQDRVTLPLPQDEESPQLGMDSQSLLAVYPRTIFRLTDRKWTLVHSGGISLPRSGPPPYLHGSMVFFRDEGRHENRKRLWWLVLGEQERLTSLDGDMGLIGPAGPNWYNSFSYCVTRSGDLWACVGEGFNRKSLFRRSKDGSYSIAIMNNSVRFTEELFGSPETDQGLSVSAVAALPDDTLLLAGDAGLYRLTGDALVPELAFTNTQQEITDGNGKVVSHWHWDPSNVLLLDDKSYFLSGAFGGIYLLQKGNDGQWSFRSLDEKLGDPVVW